MALLRREGMGPLLGRGEQIGYFGLLMAAITLLASSAFHRNLVWQTRTTVWEDVTLKSPGKARGYYNYGVYMQKYGDLNKALELYSRAIQIEPGKTEALVNRGNVYDDMALRQLALEDYGRALAFDPRNESAYFNRGVTFERLGLIPAALADYDQACGLGPERGCISREKLASRTGTVRPVPY